MSGPRPQGRAHLLEDSVSSDPSVLQPNRELVAYCGLYCGACRSYRKGRCPGCHGNDKATWCKVRACCREHGHSSCADCKDHVDPATCTHFNTFFAKLFGVVFNSDRRACIVQIRDKGIDEHAAFMAHRRRQSLPRRGRSAAR
jgi:hypothetical protein